MGNVIAPPAASKALLENREEIYRMSLTLFLAICLLFIPDIAHAADGVDPLSRTICLVVGWLTGGMGQAIATMGIVMLGIGAMMGKVTWQVALIVSFGLSVMFSGAQIVTLLTSKNAGFCVGDPTFTAGYLESILCRVAALASTATGRALSTLAIIFLGITALMGKTSAGVAILLATGIGVMHGADELGQQLVEAMGERWISCSPVAG